MEQVLTTTPVSCQLSDPKGIGSYLNGAPLALGGVSGPV